MPITAKISVDYAYNNQRRQRVLLRCLHSLVGFPQETIMFHYVNMEVVHVTD